MATRLNGRVASNSSTGEDMYIYFTPVDGQNPPREYQYPCGRINLSSVTFKYTADNDFTVELYISTPRQDDYELLDSIFCRLSSPQETSGRLGSYTVNVPYAANNTHRIKFLIRLVKVSAESTLNFNLIGASVTAEFETRYTPVSLLAGTGGTLMASSTSPTVGTVVDLYPIPDTGYRFTGYTSQIYYESYWYDKNDLISGNSFEAPIYDVKITASFEDVSFTVSTAVNPNGAGTVTVDKSTAIVGETVTLSQTPEYGYAFGGWESSPAVTINSSGQFTMPASDVTITAKYMRRSTAYLDRSSMEGGSTVKLTINTESLSYSHKYQLSFGTGMETAVTNVAAGVTTVNISVPLNWCQSIPDATSKTGGTMTVWTYVNGTETGYYTITGLTYTVPGSIVPTLTDITTSIARTIGGKTYANVGDYYVQNHSGVRIQATAAGVQGATIASVIASMSGYSGTNYNKTQASVSLDFTSGLLSNSGACIITVRATDSRGRTTTKTATITVTPYKKPWGSLIVWRVDEGGDVDEFGERAMYSLTRAYTQIGSNSITSTLECNSQTESNPVALGDILPSNRLALSVFQEYTVTLKITDAFETTTIEAKVQSAKFVIHVDSGGDRMGIMKAANKQIPTGKASTFEIAETCQVYIGDYTLEDYIRLIVNS